MGCVSTALRLRCSAVLLAGLLFVCVIGAPASFAAPSASYQAKVGVPFTGSGYDTESTYDVEHCSNIRNVYITWLELPQGQVGTGTFDGAGHVVISGTHTYKSPIPAFANAVVQAD